MRGASQADPGFADDNGRLPGTMRWKRLLWLLPVLTGVVLALAKTGERTIDDAFILYRYAENLAAGNGLVFNQGERVEGYSSLLFVLLLAAFEKLGISTILGANLLNLAAVVAAPAAAFALAWRLVPKQPASAGLAAGFLVATCDGLVNYGLLGMETAFASALCIVALWLRWKDPPARLPSALLFGLLALTRPEGILYVAGAVLPAMRRLDWKKDLRDISVALAFPFLQLLFRLAYYRDLLPNTFHAKIWSGASRYVRGGDYLADYLHGLGFPLLLAGLLGLPFIIRCRRLRSVAGVALAGLFFGLYSGGDLYIAHRFLIPTEPVLLTLQAILAVMLLAHVAKTLAFVRVGGLLVLLLVSWTLARAPGFGRFRRELWPPRNAVGHIATNLGRLDQPSETLQVKVGKFLGRRLPNGASLTVGDCGRIPYYSKMRVVDSLGLMDRHLARAPGAVNEKSDVPYLLKRDTDYYLLRQALLSDYPRVAGLPIDHRLIHSESFQSRHELRAQFPWPHARHAYLLFEKDRRLLRDLSAGVRAGELETRGNVLPRRHDPALRRREAEGLMAELSRRPFQLLPRGVRLSRLFRYAWPFPALDLNSRDAGLVIETKRETIFVTGIEQPGARIEVLDASGITHEIEGRRLLVSIPLPPGKTEIRPASKPPITLLAPRIERAGRAQQEALSGQRMSGGGERKQWGSRARR